MLVAILIAVILCWIASLPFTYGVAYNKGIEAATPLAIAMAEHECVWDNWGEPYRETTSRHKIGLPKEYAEYQDRLCLGCGIKEVRQINPSNHY